MNRPSSIVCFVYFAAGAIPLALLSLGVGGCGSEGAPPTVFHLERPSDIAFACLGKPDASSDELCALPLPECAPKAGSVSGDADAGVDAAMAEPRFRYGFIAQSQQGTVAVALLEGFGEVKDSDPFSPGHNGLPVGRLPVEIATLPSGCFAVTANQGSCDLGVLDVLAAVESKPGAVSRRSVMATAGVVAARPAAIATPNPEPAGGHVCERARCEGGPAGLAYVAYPSCHAVAVVDVASGSVVKSVRFPAAGPPLLAEGDLSCPIECGELSEGAAAAPASAGPEPVAIAVGQDGRLFVGAPNSAHLYVIDVDAGGIPTAVTVVPLEGQVGIRRIAVSGEINMGTPAAPLPRRYAYLVATDGTIRVVDVSPAAAPMECETQADPRFLTDIRDRSVFACIPIGTVPRRATATGPGIRLPFGATPRDIGFVTADRELMGTEQPDPGLLNGVFALVTADNPLVETPRGVVFYVNVNDENYPDFEDPAFPQNFDFALALPHTLRDNVPFRRQNLKGCAEPTLAPTAGPVRIEGNPSVFAGFETLPTNVTGTADDPLVPMLHRVQCSDPEAGIRQVVWQLAAASPAAERERVFADLGQILREAWFVTWEGPLGTEDGALREGGQIEVQPTTITLTDPLGPFCDMGVELYDAVRLVGCTEESDCALGETCFVHPDAPVGTGGMCLPAGQENLLRETCRPMLTSFRQYYVAHAEADRLVLESRARVLGSTPIGGCTDDAQCQALADALEPEVAQYQWICGADPSFRGQKRCIMACGGDGGGKACEPGTICQAGRCVLGPIPDPACVSPLQRYIVTAGEAYTVVGSLTGYLHRRMVDPVTNQCIEDPTASPLRAGRFRRDEPACVDDSITGLSPNPCSLVLDEPISATETRPSQGIRFRNPGLTFEVADVVIPIPGMPGLWYSPVTRGYGFRFSIAGAFAARNVALEAAMPDRIRVGTDGALYVVDVGDHIKTGARGQVIRVGPSGPEGTRLF